LYLQKYFQIFLFHFDFDHLNFRLNIDEKLDIISDSDIDKDDESIASDNPDLNTNNSLEKKAEPVTNDTKPTPSKNELSTSTKNLNEKSKYVPRNTSTPTAATKLPKPSFRLLLDYDKETIDAPERSSAYYRYIEKASEEVAEEVCILDRTA